MQPQGHLQLISSTVDDGADPQAALGAPRWYWEAGRAVSVESALDSVLVTRLRERGHEISIGDESLFGYGQAIWRLSEGGYVAGSEPRADGCAMAY
jgi:gamma-glutamyltranspeptidase/glutathione hydrolase